MKRIDPLRKDVDRADWLARSADFIYNTYGQIKVMRSYTGFFYCTLGTQTVFQNHVFFVILASILWRFYPRIGCKCALTLPIASFSPDDYQRVEPGIEGLVNLVKWEVWKWDGQEESTRHPLPESQKSIFVSGIFPESHPIAAHLIPAGVALLENLAMFAEPLMEQLLEADSAETRYADIKVTAILQHLRKATISGDISPVLCGSAVKNIGTDLVLDYVGELFASPKDVSINISPVNTPLLMLAWKVAWDKRKGWMSFIRIYSGKRNHQKSSPWRSNDTPFPGTLTTA